MEVKTFCTLISGRASYTTCHVLFVREKLFDSCSKKEKYMGIKQSREVHPRLSEGQLPSRSVLGIKHGHFDDNN